MKTLSRLITPVNVQRHSGINVDQAKALSLYLNTVANDYLSRIPNAEQREFITPAMISGLKRRLYYGRLASDKRFLVKSSTGAPYDQVVVLNMSPRLKDPERLRVLYGVDAHEGVQELWASCESRLNAVDPGRSSATYEDLALYLPGTTFCFSQSKYVRKFRVTPDQREAPKYIRTTLDAYYQLCAQSTKIPSDVLRHRIKGLATLKLPGYDKIPIIGDCPNLTEGHYPIAKGREGYALKSVPWMRFLTCAEIGGALGLVFKDPVIPDRVWYGIRTPQLLIITEVEHEKAPA